VSTANFPELQSPANNPSSPNALYSICDDGYPFAQAHISGIQTADLVTLPNKDRGFVSVADPGYRYTPTRPTFLLNGLPKYRCKARMHTKLARNSLWLGEGPWVA
jgi:hypothetical protein